MKLAGTVGKSIIPVLAVAAIVWFYADLSSVPASGSLLEKLIITKPVVLAIRISLLFVALGVAGLIVLIFWKQITVVKISSSGIEFGKFDEISDKTQTELAGLAARVKELETENELLRKQKKELQKRINAMYTRKKGA